MPPTDSSLAFNVADYQLDPAAERFFDQPCSEQDELAQRPASLAPTQRRAMRATFAMLGVFAVALTLFLVYARVIMPVPADLDADRTQVLP
ncbi:MAG TPA: hypothetical protein VFN67_05805 [Polyangiales bacterium]|jgi:hypothetical protein|nr:hypothetical protein [Polyangiales bacterium]